MKQLYVYLSKIPAKARELDIFQLKPLPQANAPEDPSKPWFAAVPFGGENKWSRTRLQKWALLGRQTIV